MDGARLDRLHPLLDDVGILLARAGHELGLERARDGVVPALGIGRQAGHTLAAGGENHMRT